MSERQPPPSPYVGPRPFTREDRFFYGREREVRELRDLLVAERIVLLYSPSGAGKTSLIQAGLLPKLLESRFHILPTIRVNQPPIAELADRANRYVLSALLALEAARPPADQREPSELAALTLPEYVAQLPDSAEKSAGHVFIFDQFEEILTLDPTDISAKSEFFAQVGEMLRGRLRWALFALREDHVAALDPYLPSIPNRLETTFRLDLLGPTAARQAIQRPAAGVGVEFTDDAAQRLVDDLRRVRVQQPDGSVAEVPGPYIEPVQLQVVCQQLWNHLAEGHGSIDAGLVARYGDVDSALRDFYSQAVKTVAAQTGVSERDIRDWFDEHLITEHGVRSLVQLEAGEGAGLPYPAIQALINTHLVRAESRRGVTFYELAHDRLIDPIRADNEEWYERNLSPLQQAAEIWDSEGRTPGYLLAGEALAKAERWAAAHRDSLADVDLAFLEESRTQRELQEAERKEEQLLVEQQLREAAEARQQAEAAARHEAEQRATEQAAAAQMLRRRFMFAVAAVVLALVAAGIAVWAFRQADEQRDVAQQLQAIAETRATEVGALERTSRSQLLAKQAEDEQRLGPALLLASDALSAADTPQARRVLLQKLWDAPDAQLFGGNGDVSRLEFSPDGNVLAAVIDGALQLWSVEDEEPLGAPIASAGFLHDVAFAPEDGQFVTGGERGVQLWRLDSMEPKPLDVGTIGDVTGVAFSPDGQIIASGDSEGQVTLFTLATRTSQPLPVPATGVASRVNAVAFSSQGWIAAGREDGTITVWDRSEGNGVPPAFTLAPPARDAETSTAGRGIAVSSLSFHPGEATLAGGYSNGVIWLWDLARQQTIGFLNQDGVAITSLEFSPDGGLIAAADEGRSAEEGGRVVLWIVQNHSRLGPLALGHLPLASSVAFSPSGALLASGSAAGAIYLWDLQKPPLIATTVARLEGSPVTAAAFAPGADQVAVGSDSGELRVCSTRDHEASAACNSLPGDFAPIRGLSFSHDGTLLAVGDAAGSVSVQALDQDRELMSFSVDLPIETLAFSGDDRFLAAGLGERSAEPATAGASAGAIVLWDLQTGRETRSDRDSSVTALIAGPAPSELTSFDDQVSVWTVSDNGLSESRATWLPGVAATPEGGLGPSANGEEQILAPGDGGDGTDRDLVSRVRNLSAASEIRSTRSVAFDPEGGRLASATIFGTIYIWDLEQEGNVAVHLGTLPSSVVVGLEWHEKDRLLAIDSQGSLIELKLAAKDWITAACRAVQAFTSDQVSADALQQTCQGVLAGSLATPASEA